MKFSKFFIFVTLLLLIAGTAFSQSKRRNQIELYGGAALPMAPDAFKDYFKTGLSLHGQYVIFPNPKLGVSFGVGYEIFTVDNDALKEDYGIYDEIDVEGNANITELSVGVRPYLSAPEANTQFFLFGLGTYNLLKTKVTVKGFGEEYEETADDDKFGASIGAGIEMPMGETKNLIFQGLYRFIFTEDETTSFLGITAGIIF